VARIELHCCRRQRFGREGVEGCDAPIHRESDLVRARAARGDRDLPRIQHVTLSALLDDCRSPARIGRELQLITKRGDSRCALGPGRPDQRPQRSLGDGAALAGSSPETSSVSSTWSSRT
jgi:hypothetical protein